MKTSTRFFVLMCLLLLHVAVGRHAHHLAQSDKRPNSYKNGELKGIPSETMPKGFTTIMRQHGRINKGHGRHKHRGKEAVLQGVGSALPDCSHACGRCSPCRRVTVSLKCSLLAEAESCPMAYRCMCRGKPFPVP
eukprot:Gb_00388 [translate_table: standard]